LDPRDEVRKAFDLLAEDYARLRSSGFDETARLVSGREFASICDAGSGPDTYGRLFAGASRIVVQLDLSEEMVRVGRRRISSEGIDWKVHSIVCDATSLPFRSNLFDLTASVAVLHHLTKELAERALLEFLRITAPCKVVFLSVWSPAAMDRAHTEEAPGEMSLVWWKTRCGDVARHYRKWQPSELRDLCESCGYRYLDAYVSGKNIFVAAMKL
jgi:SAM-dependent methyltransferase